MAGAARVLSALTLMLLTALSGCLGQRQASEPTPTSEATSTREAEATPTMTPTSAPVPTPTSITATPPPSPTPSATPSASDVAVYSVSCPRRARIGDVLEVEVNTSADMVLVELMGRNYTAELRGCVFKAYVSLAKAPEREATMRVYCIRGREAEVRELKLFAYDIPEVELRVEPQKLTFSEIIIEKYRRYLVRGLQLEEVRAEAVVEDSSQILAVTLYYGADSTGTLSRGVSMELSEGGTWSCTLPWELGLEALRAGLADDGVHLRAVAEDRWRNRGVAEARLMVEVRELVIRGVSFHEQIHEKPWCMTACIQMLLDYWSCSPLPSQEEIAEHGGWGEPTYGFISYLRSLGFTLEEYRVSMQEQKVATARRLLSQGYPLIAGVFIPDLGGHAIVLYGYDNSRKKFYTLDPAGWMREVSYAEFRLRCYLLYVLKPISMGLGCHLTGHPALQEEATCKLETLAERPGFWWRWPRCIEP